LLTGSPGVMGEMLRKLGFIVVVVIVVTSVSVPAWSGSAAGTISGAISGYVRDGSGAPQMGAVVEVIGSAAQALKVFTDDRGFYSVAKLLPGTYSVKVSAPAFLPTLREKIGVRAGAKLDPAAKVRVAAINERLAALFANFSQNLLAEEADYALYLKRETDLAGVPESLRAAGLDCVEHRYPDHYALQSQDICFEDALPVLMTEKDAVKCRPFAKAQHWYLPVTAAFEPADAQALLRRIFMDKRLLDILACPLCKGPLVHNRDQDLLVCRADRLAFPIRDGVPIMLQEEARILESSDPLLVR